MHSSPSVAKAAVRSKAAFLLLLICCFMYRPLFGGSVLAFFWSALLYVLFGLAIILTRKRKLVALLLLSFGCLVTVNVLWLFLMVPWVGLRFVILVFSSRVRLFFYYQLNLEIARNVQGLH